jgi:hypothetical protein
MSGEKIMMDLDLHLDLLAVPASNSVVPLEAVIKHVRLLFTKWKPRTPDEGVYYLGYPTVLVWLTANGIVVFGNCQGHEREAVKLDFFTCSHLSRTV